MGAPCSRVLATLCALCAVGCEVEEVTVSDDAASSLDAARDARAPIDTPREASPPSDRITPDGTPLDDRSVPADAPLGPMCATADDCPNDARCDPEAHRCAPFADGQTDPTCTREVRPGIFAPAVQCRFSDAPAGDRFPMHVHVLSTPMVADLRVYRGGPDDPVRPSIVAVFDDGEDGGSENPTGLIRILDGRTCALQANLDAQLVSHSSPPAVGDLDGDGTPEIVAFKAGGGLVAFRYQISGTTGAWRVMWRSTNTDGSTAYNPTGGGWAGPSIADTDDDGRPEVLRHGLVFNGQTGALVGGASQLMAHTAYSAGLFTVVADADEDGRPELITGTGVFAWSPTTRDWVREAYSAPLVCAGMGCGNGQIALANFGAYTSARFTDAGTPEIAVVSSGYVRIDTLDGRTVFGPVALPGGGTGGAPTVADFDGDGLPEVAAAGARAYTVFDPDCAATVPSQRAGGRCGTSATNGVLWSAPSQDASSNVTGSTSFDFEADGRVEAVYADECFARVYDGRTGTVLFSQHHSSCTWYENPVVADVDGDFRAELVVGSNFNCGSATTGIACPGTGPRGVDVQFAGIRCAADTDCPSSACAGGFCRCTTDAQCCPPGGAGECTYVCAPPPAGTAGTGNTCRAARPVGVHGIRVYQDVADRWVRSRMVWNQHVYSVTNVGDDLRIPRASLLRPNWRDPALNNFRTNVQGGAGTMASPDVTAGRGRFECVSPTMVRLTARACNRGTAPLADGVPVGFYVGEGMMSMRLCGAVTARALNPGDCVELSCEGVAPTDTAPVTVHVVADDARGSTECHEGNNLADIPSVSCRSPG